MFQTKLNLTNARNCFFPFYEKQAIWNWSFTECTNAIKTCYAINHVYKSNNIGFLLIFFLFITRHLISNFCWAFAIPYWVIVDIKRLNNFISNRDHVPLMLKIIFFLIQWSQFGKNNLCRFSISTCNQHHLYRFVV